MKVLSSFLFVLLSISCCYGQSDFIVSEANTLGGLYFYSDSLYVVSAADRAHVKSVLDQDSDYATYNLALLGPGYYNYRDICSFKGSALNKLFINLPSNYYKE